MKIKGELFSQEFIPKLLDGTKIRTSRPYKGYAAEHTEVDVDGNIIGIYDQENGFTRPISDYSKYQIGDVMYVRETWCEHPKQFGKYYYRANSICAGKNTEECPDTYDYTENCDLCEMYDGWIKWRPSIHMPIKAARIFLHVTDVKAQRLDSLTEQEAIEEGLKATHELTATSKFNNLWLGKYGLDYPWMWVYYFERISKEVVYEF